MKLGRPMSMKKKIAIVLVVVTAVLTLLLFRVAWIQFVRGNEYQKLAYSQQNSGRTIPATRGSILDRNGSELAISITARQISVNQVMIATQGKKLGDTEGYQRMIAEKLAEFLDKDAEGILKKIQSSGKYVEIARKVEVELADKIQDWITAEKIKGVYIDEDVKRYYPNGSLACHVLGFTGRDDQGLVCGVEVALDSYLAGKPGRIVSPVDSKGNALPYAEETRVEPEDGYTAKLTIDTTIQSIAENVLEEVTATWNVIEGCAAIVIEPSTGNLLAFASNPGFDLNDPYACPITVDPAGWTGTSAEDVETLSSTVWRNKCLTDTYEPGSTFKAITAAMGVEEGIVNAETMVNDSPLSMSGWDIRCWKREGHGIETFATAVKNSCNAVFAKLALELGNDTFYKYMDSFGFYDKTGILLSGEAGSIIHTAPAEIDRAVTGFGQRIQITPIQLARAYCAVANGGYLVTPRIVDEIVDSNGNVVERFEIKNDRQVISASTSQQVLSMLEGVVSDGTGHNAYVPGYRVAGKTGTSETIETDTTGRYVASFCGIAPIDNPQIVVLVMVDHPDQNITVASGGRQAAPAAAKIIERTLEYLGVERRYTSDEEKKFLVQSPVPDVVGLDLISAVAQMDTYGLDYKIVGTYSEDPENPPKVTEQMPASGIIVNRNTKVVLYVDETPQKTMVKVPDLVGKDLSDAFLILQERGLGMIAKNSGIVTSQSIEPGAVVEEGTVITVTLAAEDGVGRGAHLTESKGKKGNRYENRGTVVGTVCSGSARRYGYGYLRNYCGQPKERTGQIVCLY